MEGATDKLQYTGDHYGGVLIEADALPGDLVVFGQMLEASLAQWREEEKRGVWLKVPSAKAHLISIAVELGFAFHHADPAYVMLTLWLPKKTPSTLPGFASHYVGVGGVVINDKTQEILVVKERNGPITKIWKFPGGMLELGEEIKDGVVREVKEETGIDARFVSLLCFRENTQSFHGRSDLYFVCRLEPLSFDIKKQDSEIEECKWMPMSEFVGLPYYKGLYKKIIDVAAKSAGDGGYRGLAAENLPIVFRSGTNTLYHAAASL